MGNNYSKPEYQVMREIEVSPEIRKLVEKKVQLIVDLKKVEYQLALLDHTLKSFQFAGSLIDGFAFLINDDGSLKGMYEVLDPIGFAEYDNEFRIIINKLAKQNAGI